jgi:hypothetical protein
VATAKDFRRIAMSLDGTTEAPHFDRTAFKGEAYLRDARRRRQNRRFHVCARRAGSQMRACSGRFSVIPNAWGARGATTGKLSALSIAELRDALTVAWRHAVPAKPSRGRSSKRFD